jgi:YVTN family beta-propeller protein
MQVHSPSRKEIAMRPVAQASIRRYPWAQATTLLLLVALAAGVVTIRRAAMAPVLWTVGVGHGASALALAPRVGRVFVANSDDQTVTMLDARSGAVLATIAVGGVPIALAVDETAGRVFTVNARASSCSMPACYYGLATVSVLDIRSGALIRTVGVGRGAAAVALDERAGRVFVANVDDATVSVLDASSGRVLRTVDLAGSTPLALAVDARTRRVFVSRLFGSRGRMSGVSLLDSRTGALVRTVRVDRIMGQVLVDPRHGHVVVASASGLHVLEARTGRLLRRIRAIEVPLAVDARDGRVLVSGHDHLRLLDIRSGLLSEPVLAGASPGPLTWIDTTAVDETRGRIFVIVRAADGHGVPTERERLAVLDGRSGTLLQSIAIGADVVALAVDPRTQRAFIVRRAVVADGPRRPDGVAAVTAWARRVLPWLPLPQPDRARPGDSVSVLEAARR